MALPLFLIVAFFKFELQIAGDKLQIVRIVNLLSLFETLEIIRSFQS